MCGAPTPKPGCGPCGPSSVGHRPPGRAAPPVHPAGHRLACRCWPLPSGPSPAWPSALPLLVAYAVVSCGRNGRPHLAGSAWALALLLAAGCTGSESRPEARLPFADQAFSIPSSSCPAAWGDGPVVPTGPGRRGAEHRGRGPVAEQAESDGSQAAPELRA